jgi:hypothetical protein
VGAVGQVSVKGWLIIETLAIVLLVASAPVWFVVAGGLP